MAAAQHADASTLEALRSRRLAGLLAHAVRASPLYRRRFEGIDLGTARLSDLPVAHKRELMAGFDDWVTDPQVRLDEVRRFVADRSRIGEPFLGRYTVWESSGSSGEPGIFLQDASALAVYDALEALRRSPLRPLQRLLDPCYLGERIAFVGALGGHFAGTVTAERLRRLNPMLAGRLHEVSFMQPVGPLLAELNALAPTILSTYPSAAVMLAHERLAGRLTARIQEIWTGGETLSAAMRRFVQDAFGCLVSDSYGASEFIALASQCSRGRLHLNSDWAILEPVDETGRAVPAGAPASTTLLTNLANHVQPLIRYDIGDRVRLLPRACGCGSHLPVIEVLGRSDDTLVLGSGAARAVRVLPLALTTVLEDEAGLFDFQLEQLGPSELRLCTPMHGAPAVALLQRARTALLVFLSVQGVSGVRVHCHSGEPGRRGPGGKIQRVVGRAASPSARATAVRR